MGIQAYPDCEEGGERREGRVPNTVGGMESTGSKERDETVRRNVEGRNRA